MPDLMPTIQTPILDTDDSILSQGETCEMLRVSPQTLRRLADEGHIDFIRLPGHPHAHRRFQLSAIRTFLKNQTQHARI